MASARQSLQRLAFAPKTGIGSLPHLDLGAALRIAFDQDIPFLPQLPGEEMLSAALDGLPGFGADGAVDLDGWRRKRDPFSFAVEGALASGELSAYEPSAHTAFQPFVLGLKSGIAKVQIAGPATVRWWVKMSTGEPVSEVAELDQQIFRLLLAKSLAVAAAVRRTGVTPLLFLDEPGLVCLQRANAQHGLVLQELKLLIHAVQSAGALVGVHCCGNTDWAALLGLGLDVLSFDARLSLDAVLDEKAAVDQFLDSGATFALGIIPTNVGAKYAVPELVDAVEVSLRSTVPKAQLGRMILTPACGLAGHSIEDADRIVAEVGQAQARLRALA